MWRFLSITETYSYVDIFCFLQSKTDFMVVLCDDERERERHCVGDFVYGIGICVRSKFVNRFRRKLAR